MPTPSRTAYRIPEPQLYVIHDRPVEKLPIRRLQTEGPDVLSTGQLLQIALGQADGLEDSLQEYGVQFLTTLHSVSDVVEALKVDHLQATRLLAMLSLGRRLFSPAEGSMPVVRGIEDIFNAYRSMASLAKEQLRLLLINSRYQVVHEEVLAIGGVEGLQIPMREVFQPAVERRVVAVILVHNHPTGDPTPSEADIAFTQQVAKAGKLLGIELLDHVVIGRDSYRSCLSLS